MCRKIKCLQNRQEREKKLGRKASDELAELLTLQTKVKPYMETKHESFSKELSDYSKLSGNACTYKCRL